MRMGPRAVLRFLPLLLKTTPRSSLGEATTVALVDHVTRHEPGASHGRRSTGRAIFRGHGLSHHGPRTRDRQQALIDQQFSNRQ